MILLKKQIKLQQTINLFNLFLLIKIYIDKKTKLISSIKGGKKKTLKTKN